MFEKFLNRLRIHQAFTSGIPGRPFYPQQVVLELTNHCNLACVMCAHSSMTREKGFMEEGLFKSIIDEISPYSELVFLHQMGESLLHKKLPDYVTYAAQSGLSTLLSTNGIPLTEDNATALLNSGLTWLIVALDGGTKETYENIRINGRFDRLVANIKMLLRLKKALRSPVKIILQLILMPDNVHEFELFKSMFTSEERGQVSLFRIKHCFTFPTGRPSVAHTTACFWLWNMASIDWTGRMPICCMDSDASHPVGDLGRQRLGEVWNSEKLWELRRRHKSLDLGGLEPCDGCDVAEQGFFRPPAILASTILSARMLRSLMPLAEGYYARSYVAKHRKG